LYPIEALPGFVLAALGLVSAGAAIALSLLVSLGIDHLQARRGMNERVAPSGAR
jgi:hypothetical protein